MRFRGPASSSRARGAVRPAAATPAPPPRRRGAALAALLLLAAAAGFEEEMRVERLDRLLKRATAFARCFEAAGAPCLWRHVALAPEALEAEAALAAVSSSSSSLLSSAPPPSPTPASPRILLYVVCHDAESEATALSGFARFPWAAVHRLADADQDHLFEGAMHARVLARLEHEWLEGGFDFVGTVSYKLAAKVNMTAFLARLRSARTALEDVVYFLPGVGDPFSGHSDALRPVFQQLLAQVGLPPLQHEAHVWSFCNFWMARPAYMRSFARFVRNRWLPSLEAHPLVWSDAQYRDATLSPNRLRQLSGGRAAFYSLHPFLSERVVSVFFARATRARLGCTLKLLRADYGVEMFDWSLHAGILRDLSLRACVMRHVAAAQGSRLRVSAASLGGRDPAPGRAKRLNLLWLDERCEIVHVQARDGDEVDVPLLADAFW